MRYVYHPVDSLYLVAVTTKHSNIVEDIETVRQLAEILPAQLPNYAVLDESTVASHAFSLLFAVDELISAGGHREHISASAVAANLAMESHEETLAIMIKKSREEDAARASARRAAELQRARRAQMAAGGSSVLQNAMAVSSDDRMQSGASPSGGPSSGKYGAVSSASMASSSGAARASGNAYSGSSQPQSSPAAASKLPASIGQRMDGMRLGSRKAAPEDSAAAVMAEAGITAPVRRANEGSALGVDATSAAMSAAAAAAAAAATEAISVSISEHISVAMTSDGAVDMATTGSVAVKCAPQAVQARVQLTGAALPGCKVQNNPNTDKDAWVSEQAIALREGKVFPANTAITAVRWRRASKNLDDVPLGLNVWPEDDGMGGTTLSVEYTLQGGASVTLRDVVVTLPPGSSGSGAPDISVCDGEARAVDGRLVWTIGDVSQGNSAGELACTLSGVSPESCFPVTVSFSAAQPLSGLAALHASAPDGQELRMKVASELVVDKYVVLGV